MKNKNKLIILLAIVMSLSVLSGCSAKQSETELKKEPTKVEQYEDNSKDEIKKETSDVEKPIIKDDTAKEEKPTKKPEIKVPETYSQNVNTYRMLDPNSNPVKLQEKVCTVEVRTGDELDLANKMYDVMQENSDNILPDCNIKSAKIKENGVLYLEFDKDFLINFGGGTFGEKVAMDTMTYGFMSIPKLRGVCFFFETSENSKGLHADYENLILKGYPEQEYEVVR